MVRREDLIKLLEEADYPKPDIARYTDKLLNLQDESKSVLENWAATGKLPGSAFNIAGVTPLVVREQFPKVKDPAIILIYDQLISVVKKEWQFILAAASCNAKISLVYEKLGQRVGAAVNAAGKKIK